MWETTLNQVRPYLALKMLLSIIHSIDNRNMTGGIYNVVTNNSTVQEIVSIIQEYKPSVTTSLIKSTIMNSLSYSVGCQKICSTGFQPAGSLKNSIYETMKILGGL